jgi:hypothetical protein
MVEFQACLGDLRVVDDLEEASWVPHQGTEKSVWFVSIRFIKWIEAVAENFDLKVFFQKHRCIGTGTVS